MFGKEFYPTPEDVIARMMANSDVAGKVVLEHSAGKGNIVDWLYQHNAKEVIACEIEPNLRVILQSKCRVIADNFLKLQAEEISHVDFIIMNPPFFGADNHILHAWEIAPDGCEIIGLCNSETLQNRWSTGRKQLMGIVADFGYSESFGDCFKWAERETEVNVSVVRLYKPKKAEQEFDGYFDTNEEYEHCETPGMMTYNVIREIVNRYVGCVKEYDKVLEAAVNIKRMSGPIHIDKLTFTCTAAQQPMQRQTFKKELQKNAWRYIFSEMNMSKYVTTSVMSDINRFVEQQTQVPFTMKNIYKMFDLIIGTHAERMDRVLEEAFDTICSYSSQNSTAGEKWKTNSNYKVNLNFIKPYMTRIGWHGELELSYHSSDRLQDIEKALCFMTGTDYNELPGLSEFIDKTKPEWGKWYSWNFFEIKGYKKGTMHFKFADVKVWETFNRRVAEIKGWQLPTKTDNKTTGRERAKSTGIEVFEF